jgi:hypothetical protein
MSKCEVEGIDVGAFRPSQQESKRQDHYSIYELQYASADVESFQIAEGNWRFGNYFLPFSIVYSLFLLCRFLSYVVFG